MAIGLDGDAGVRGCGHFDFESKKISTFSKVDFILGRSSGGGGRSNSNKRSKKTGGGEQLFVAMVLIQVFAGNLALYGLITSIILTQTGYNCEY
jgi:hypothetical protein